MLDIVWHIFEMSMWVCIDVSNYVKLIGREGTQICGMQYTKNIEGLAY